MIIITPNRGKDLFMMWSLGLILFCISAVESAPVVTSVTPGAVILSGGVSITVTGTGLTDNTQPKIVITATYTTVSDVFSGSACTVITPTTLVCPAPKITLTKFTEAGYSNNGTSELLNNNQLSFQMGTSWNGVTTWERFRSISAYKDPSIRMENPKRTYTVWTNRIVNIFGTNLDKFITDKSEYDISISNLKCPVNYLNSSFMRCLLPTASPVPNDADNLHSLVILKLGDFTTQLGRLWYRIPTFSDNITGLPEIFYPNDPTDKISINGTNFMVAITSGNTYYIQIGQGECTNIELTATVIKCRPPNIQPTSLTTLPQLNNYPQIVVTVPKSASDAAHQYTQHVGYVFYSDRVFTTVTTTTTSNSGGTSNGTSDPWNSLWKWVLLGIAFFLGVLFLVLLLCCVCCMPYLRRDKKAWEESEEDDSYYDRNTSNRSSFHSYHSKATGNTHLESDGSRLYYVTDVKLPSRHYYH